MSCSSAPDPVYVRLTRVRIHAPEEVQLDKLTQLQEEALELTRSERAQLMSTLAYAERDKAEERLDREERLVLQELKLLTQNPLLGTRSFLVDFGARKFSNKVDDLYAFARGTGQMLRRGQVDDIVRVALRCVISEMARMEVPTTPRTVMDHLPLVEAAIDRRFPGYIQAGMLHRIVGAVVEEARETA